jgi:hypothetical protein
MLSVVTRAIGFDVEPEPNLIVSAVSVRREQLAKSSRQRQRDPRSGCGLNGVGEQGARVAHRRKHTSSAETRPRVTAQIQRMVEAPTPRRQEHPIAPKSDTHVSEGFVTSFADTGSIPVACTGLAAAPTLKAVHQPIGGDGVIRRSAWRSLVARCGNAEVARSNRAADPHRKQLSKSVRSAQLNESARRRASEDLSASGSSLTGLGGHGGQPASNSTGRASA